MAGIGANEPFTSLIKNGSICPKPDSHDRRNIDRNRVEAGRRGIVPPVVV
jgi:hypothetical protein